LSAFLEGTGIARADMRPAQFQNATDSLRTFGVAASDEALIWLLDPAFDWPNGASESQPKPFTGGKVTLAGVENGTWDVEWWNTLAGERLASNRARVADGALQLEAPSFVVDVAARLRKR
jgi:hypothetical protein